MMPLPVCLRGSMRRNAVSILLRCDAECFLKRSGEVRGGFEAGLIGNIADANGAVLQKGTCVLKTHRLHIFRKITARELLIEPRKIDRAQKNRLRQSRKTQIFCDMIGDIRVKALNQLSAAPCGKIFRREGEQPVGHIGKHLLKCNAVFRQTGFQNTEAVKRGKKRFHAISALKIFQDHGAEIMMHSQALRVGRMAERLTQKHKLCVKELPALTLKRSFHGAEVDTARDCVAVVEILFISDDHGLRCRERIGQQAAHFPVLCGQRLPGFLSICADHGNAEQMIDYTTGNPHTAHTTNPVPFILVNADPSYTLREGGCLADIIPTLIDELPMIAAMACFAEGDTIIRDAAELKVKESNRIAIMVENLRAMGADVEETDDGMIIHGGKPLHGAVVDSHKDHRIAMTFAIAALAADGETEILDADCVDISYPSFYKELKKLAC